MRIQHNIMAMSAYRNYTNNVSAMKKNLEKLSSGYKINRAGDDAAGLAISEKMRAQITGLETAQKNAKDGISLVQTAEGALTEVHDMLNRMVELATQSANGTYDNETDRYQLQKEVDQLKSEINRIADSANFNGIKLLDGSMAAVAGVAGSTTTETVNESYTGMDRIIESVIGKGEQAYEVAGDKTILDGAGAAATVAKFQVDLATMNFKAPDTYTIASASTVKLTVTFATASGGTSTATVAIKGTLASVDGKMFQVGDTFEVTATAASIAGVELEVTVGAGGKLYAKAVGGSKAGNIEKIAIATMAAASDVKIKDTVSVTVGGVKLSTGSKGFTLASVGASVNSASIAKVIASAIANNNSIVEINGMKWSVKATGTKLQFEQITTPETKDQARANFDVKISIEKAGASAANAGGNFGITLDGNSSTTTQATTTVGSNGTVTMSASIKAGTYVNQAGVAEADVNKANTIFNIRESDLVDGAKIAIGTRTLTLAIGPDSEFKTGTAAAANTSGYVALEADDDLNTALSKISKALGSTVNFMIKDKNGGIQNVSFQIGVSDGAHGYPAGLAVQRVDPYISTATSGASSCSFNTLDKLAANFKMQVSGTRTTVIEEVKEQKGLTLQIGDTAEDFNQLNVSIEDCHADAIGIGDIDISTQDGAADAVDKIKAAINYVSDVRGTLGATQNRLDHTINNLSVMTENIQDAESTIRDVDVAEEMMAYTKNNILIQSAQAMLAQANQVPQGVLQLLQ